jgi:PTH1 family peptidyl-tRNA hydrolase
MKLIVGLGNPGRFYVNNRHNVGFRCLDYFARKQGISLNLRRARSQLGMGEVEGRKVVLAKPRTFMNLSGEAVAALMRRHRLTTKDLIVIYDDLDLPLGKIRIRERGSSGGHKGVNSIIAHLESQDFPRIRVGIAPPEGGAEAFAERVDTVEYVLSDFAAEEKPIIREVYPEVADAIYCLITDGIAAAMMLFLGYHRT